MTTPKGARLLLAELNQALFDMQADGTLARLTAEYTGLDQEEIPPLPEPETPPPAATAVPPDGCINSSEYVSDLNHDHQGLTNIPQMVPGQSFQKGWRLRNSGTCTWDKETALIPVDGNVPAARMGGVPVIVETLVEPGQTYDFWADLVAPVEAGTYVEYWSMRNNRSGLLFGERVAVAVDVLVAVTPTPPPTQTPSPGISFSVSPEVIQQGECATLTWNTQNVQAVYLYEQGENWQDNGVTGTGSQVVCPQTTTTYELRVVKTNGSVEIRSVTVFVVPNSADVPQIDRFTVDPPNVIAVGQCVTVQWAVSGSVDTVTIWRNNVAIWPNAPVNGSMQDCPPNTGPQVYTLEATGPGGTSQANWTINVAEASTAVPTSTPTVAPMTPTPSTEPVIYYFSAQSEQINVNQCITLSWSVGGNTSRVDVRKNNAILQEDVAFRGSWSDCANSNAGTIIYELVATSNINQTVSQVVSVDVRP